jgi:predicted metal-dependent hydrolase
MICFYLNLFPTACRGNKEIIKSMTNIINIEINKIIRSKRRTIVLEITADASLVIRAPIKTSLAYINELVAKKNHWIKTKQELIKKNYVKAKPKEFVSDESFLYLGKSYRLKITDKHDNVFLDDFLYLPRSMQAKAKQHLVDWYKKAACEKVTQRLNWYSNITGLKYKSVKITNAQKRWGSCSNKGSLCFSWRLIMSPLNVLDYVIVHELAHIAEKNHSSRFWNKVKEIMPDYKEKNKWLKENGNALNL